MSPGIKALLNGLWIISLGLWLGNLFYAVQQVSGLGEHVKWTERLPYLAKVDISTVTTLVVMSTIFYVRRGWLEFEEARVRDGARLRLWRRHFPFPTTYRGFLVQLGLLGTIFAFIIAFNEMASTTTGDAVGVHDPTVLIKPLGTALWSTFAAIFVAFIVVPAVERAFRRLLAVDDESDGDLAQGLAALGQGLVVFEQRLAGASGGLDGLHRQVRSLESDLGKLDQGFFRTTVDSFHALCEKGERSLASLDRSTGELRQTLVETRSGLEKIPPTLVDTAARIEAFQIDLRSQIASEQRLTEAVVRVDQRLAGHDGDLRALTTGIELFRGGIGALGAQLSDLSGNLRVLVERLDRDAPGLQQQLADLPRLAARVLAIDRRLTLLVAGLEQGGASASQFGGGWWGRFMLWLRTLRSSSRRLDESDPT